MEIRRQMAQDLVSKTNSAQSALDDAKKEFNQIVNTANDKALQIVGKSEESAKIIAEDIKKQAQIDAQNIFEKAQKEIAKERVELRSSLEKQLASLVIETVEKIIGDLPSEQKQKVMTHIDKQLTTV